MLCEDGDADIGVGDLVHETQTGHGVFGVEGRGAVTGTDFGFGEAFGKSCAADEQRDVDAGVFEVTGGGDHLLGAFDEQARETDGVGLVLVEGFDEIVGRDFDAEVDDGVAVIAQDDFDEVLADVVDIAFDGGEDDFAAGGGIGFLHELLEVADGGFHGFGGLQDFGDDELVVVEEAADFGHTGHEGAVDDVERVCSCGALAFEVGDETVFTAFDDVVGEAFVEREIGGDFFLAGGCAAEVFGDGGDMVLVNLSFLLAGLLAPVTLDLRLAKKRGLIRRGRRWRRVVY